MHPMVGVTRHLPGSADETGFRFLLKEMFPPSAWHSTADQVCGVFQAGHQGEMDQA